MDVPCLKRSWPRRIVKSTAEIGIKNKTRYKQKPSFSQGETDITIDSPCVCPVNKHGHARLRTEDTSPVVNVWKYSCASYFSRRSDTRPYALDVCEGTHCEHSAVFPLLWKSMMHWISWLFSSSNWGGKTHKHKCILFSSRLNSALHHAARIWFVRKCEVVDTVKFSLWRRSFGHF